MIVTSVVESSVVQSLVVETFARIRARVFEILVLVSNGVVKVGA